MSTAHTPSRQSSFASINSNTAARNTALLGATKAFGRPAANRSPSSTYPVNNGAVAAATRARVGLTRREAESTNISGTNVGRNITAIPAQATRDVSPKNYAALRDVGQDLQSRRQVEVGRHVNRGRQERANSPPRHGPETRTRRPYDVDGASAQRRSAPLTASKPVPASKPRRLSVSGIDSGHRQNSRETDMSPTRPTISLVELYERKSTESGVPAKQAKAQPRSVEDLPLASPKDVRVPESGGITSMFQMELSDGWPTPKPVRNNGSSSEDYVSASEDTATPVSTAPVRARHLEASSPSSDRGENERSPIPSRTSPSPLRNVSTQPMPIKPAPYPARVSTLPVEKTSLSSQSSQSVAAQYRMLYPRRTTPLNTGNDLANALVASSLASSRAPSPSKLDVPSLNSRHKHKPLSLSRTPSPVKYGMRHTLRKVDSEESETEDEAHPYGKHHKKRHVRKHPNKHHEGDRKRWRDAVTERERKRYEGVWAANRGLHISFQPQKEQEPRRAQDTSTSPKATLSNELHCVSNIITRDIWSRSRLPGDVLADVWDLVDNDRVGRLNKEEFVVGMWLIDQRLKGRKLPVKVTPTVWQSVKGIQGIKIRNLH
ncbi:hypothetical protein LTR62_000175 [Meristemomyces frigidus]|uniref:EH domain-containing protein n=1 Tax=Meristemomyces frigidus TaxID=1508187 RepID=A0AAN7TSG4_9PEZI|nr:hypothetical protein LTR62_000175 [Meristemomyces frigidus]